MKMPKELRQELRKNGIMPMYYRLEYFIFELTCCACDGSGVVDDENCFSYECTACDGCGNNIFKLAEKQIGINPANVGYELPTQIEITDAFKSLISSVGGDVFVNEVYLPLGEYNGFGQTEYTENELRDDVPDLPF